MRWSFCNGISSRRRCRPRLRDGRDGRRLRQRRRCGSLRHQLGAERPPAQRRRWPVRRRHEGGGRRRSRVGDGGRVPGPRSGRRSRPVCRQLPELVAWIRAGLRANLLRSHGRRRDRGPTLPEQRRRHVRGHIRERGTQHGVRQRVGHSRRGLQRGRSCRRVCGQRRYAEPTVVERHRPRRTPTVSG